jgi:hypothetical protein
MSERTQYVAPVGNKFWELRAKHGRDRLFATPKLLWEAAIAYFSWCEENPLWETDFRGKDATEVKIPKMRAFTISGLCIYMNVSVDYLTAFRQSLVGRNDDLSRDFSDVINRIYDTAYTQKFTGAAAGFLNPNIIARDLGLTDKQEIKQLHQDANEYVDYTELSDEALKEITNAAETKRIEGKS